MKRRVALCLLVLLMTVSTFSVACNSASTSSTPASQSTASTPASASGGASAEESNYNPVGEMPIVKEQITLQIFAPSTDNDSKREDNVQTKHLEELTNIKLEWRIAPGDSIKERMNLMFASGDMTDIVMTGVGQASRLDMASEALLGAQGLIIPLDEYFDTVSVGYKNAFDSLAGMREYITTPDGKIYNLPNVDGSLHVQYNCKMWINTVWLDNLGLEIPKTTEDFYNVMKAFKERDANGNGNLNDEIPFSTCKSGPGTQIDGFLMNPFQLSPEDTRLYLDNGKVVFSPVTENYREGLSYISRMYKEGLINPESFTQDRQNQVNVNESGPDAVIGAFIAQRPGYGADLSIYPDNSKKWEQYQVLDPLVGPGGQQVTAWNPYIMYQTGMTFITSSSKEPEAAFRLIDYLATEEGTMFSSFGIKGEHYVDAEPGELGLNGEPAVIKTLGGFNLTGENITWNQLTGLVRSPRITEFMTVNPDPYAEDVTPLNGRQVVMYNASKRYEQYRQPIESVLPALYQSAEEVEEMSLLKTTVMDYCLESVVRFVTGDLDVEKDWDNYISQLNNIGLERYIELLQIAYDRSAFAK